jgi:hypothetical protein
MGLGISPLCRSKSLFVLRARPYGASKPTSQMFYGGSLKPWHARTFWSSRRPAACRRRKPTLTSHITLFDAGLHNRSSNRPRNWGHSRIWPSSGAIISYRRHRRQDDDRTSSEPSMLDGTSCGSPAGTKDWPARRAQAVADAHAPATAVGPGAAEGTLVMTAIFLEASPLAVPAFWPSGWP